MRYEKLKEKVLSSKLYAQHHETCGIFVENKEGIAKMLDDENVSFLAGGHVDESREYLMLGKGVGTKPICQYINQPDEYEESIVYTVDGFMKEFVLSEREVEISKTYDV